MTVTDTYIDSLDDVDVAQAAPAIRYTVVWPKIALRVAGADEDTVLSRGDTVPAGVALATCQLLATVGALVTTDDALPSVRPPVPLAPAEPYRVDPVLPTGEVVTPGAPPPPPPPLPTRSAAKAEWTAWAIDHGGIPAAAAAGMTKDQLIAALASPPPPAVDPALTPVADLSVDRDADPDGNASDAGEAAVAGSGEGDVPPSLPVNPDADPAVDEVDDPGRPDGDGRGTGAAAGG
jgi:hypothetical protein